jgi:molybdopterin-guanine dinucleotide biosynthesis protein B
MKVFGIAGHSGMGKTTILEKLIPEFSRRYLTVSLIKHSHKNIDIDTPGKDSYRLRESGCKEVLLLGNNRWALMHELRGDLEPDLQYLLSRLQQCDLVLIEGFKQGGFPKLEVWRDIQNKNTLWPKLLDIKAIASDRNIPHVDMPQFLLEDIVGIASFILANAMLFTKSTDSVLAKGDLNFD